MSVTSHSEEPTLVDTLRELLYHPGTASNIEELDLSPHNQTYMQLFYTLIRVSLT